MTWLQWAEALSYIVTIFGLPMVILVFMYEQRRERQNEEEDFRAHIQGMAAAEAGRGR